MAIPTSKAARTADTYMAPYVPDVQYAKRAKMMVMNARMPS